MVVVLMLTDVMKEASDLLFVGNDAAAAGFEKAFGGKLANSSIYKEKCLSRKKAGRTASWKALSRSRYSEEEKDGLWHPLSRCF